VPQGWEQWPSGDTHTVSRAGESGVRSFSKVFKAPLCTFLICEYPEGDGGERLSRLTTEAEVTESHSHRIIEW